jgi:geranylgeranyl diphosphate synthase type I
MRRSLGDPRLDEAGVERLREMMADTGALVEVERLIDELRDDAWTALARAEVTPETRRVLEELVVIATTRTQ